MLVVSLQTPSVLYSSYRHQQIRSLFIFVSAVQKPQSETFHYDFGALDSFISPFSLKRLIVLKTAQRERDPPHDLLSGSVMFTCTEI